MPARYLIVLGAESLAMRNGGFMSDRQGWISVPRNLPNEEWAEEMLDAGADAYIAFKQEHGSRAGLGELLRVAYHAMLAAAPQINEPPQTTTPAPASVGGKPASGSPDIQQALGEKP